MNWMNTTRAASLRKACTLLLLVLNPWSMPPTPTPAGGMGRKMGTTCLRWAPTFGLTVWTAVPTWLWFITKTFNPTKGQWKHFGQGCMKLSISAMRVWNLWESRDFLLNCNNSERLRSVFYGPFITGILWKHGVGCISVLRERRQLSPRPIAI